MKMFVLSAATALSARAAANRQAKVSGAGPVEDGGRTLTGSFGRRLLDRRHHEFGL
jgi:hypothetical protein